MDIRSLQAQYMYGAVKGSSAAASEAGKPADPLAAGADATGAAPDTFSSAVADVARGAVQSMREGEQAAMAGLTGEADAHTVVEALAATELALEAAVTVRNKVVEAYQEILRMPV